MYERNENNFTFYGNHISGICGLGGEFCKIVVDEKYVYVFVENTLVKQIDLSLVNEIGVDKEYSEKKSTAGRAILGGILGGVVGAFICAASTKLGSYNFLVSYIETQNELILFESC